MTITTKDDLINVQILVDRIRGKFKGKNAFMGSILASSGAVVVSGTMPKGGPRAIGETIEVPYFGVVGDFEDNAEGNSVTPKKLSQTSEIGTVARASLAVEISRWAEGLAAVDPAMGDPWDEAAEQFMAAATRKMDASCIAAGATSPLLHDISSLTGGDQYLTHRGVIRALTKLGDEASDDVVAMIVHSQALADLAELTDSSGRPLLVDHVVNGLATARRFAGLPLVVSDRATLGGTMGTVASSGTTPPVVTLGGTPNGPWDLVIDLVAGTTHQAATYRFSVDGGNHWSATKVTPAATVAVALTDPAVDSLVGMHGETGLTVAFAAGTFNADNQWNATANLLCESHIVQRGALAHWYNANALLPDTDKDILADSRIMSAHLYHVAHLYRRRRGGTRPGVVRIKHRVKNYVG